MVFSYRRSQGEAYPHCSRWLRIVHNVASKRITCTPARHHKLEERHGRQRGGLDCTLVHKQLRKQAVQGTRQQEPGQTTHAWEKLGIRHSFSKPQVHMPFIWTVFWLTCPFLGRVSLKQWRTKPRVYSAYSTNIAYVYSVCVFVYFQCLALTLDYLNISNLPN